MQPYQVLSVFGMVMTGAAAIVVLTGKADTRLIRASWAAIPLLLGILFVCLGLRRATADFASIPNALYMISAITMAAFFAFWIPLAKWRIIRVMTTILMGFWILVAVAVLVGI